MSRARPRRADSRRRGPSCLQAFPLHLIPKLVRAGRRDPKVLGEDHQLALILARGVCIRVESPRGGEEGALLRSVARHQNGRR